MPNPYVKSPFSDAVGPDAVPHKGSGPGQYDSSEVPDTPSGDSHIVPELHRDTHWSDPKLSGPYKDVGYKDAVK